MFDTTISTGLLHIPEQKDGGMSSFDPNPRAVEKWVKALPRADIGETARVVYKALHELNRTTVADSDRFHIAEMLREPIQFLSMSLKKHYIGLPFPLPRKKHKVALLARELQSEMAIAYKIIIENKLARGAKRLEQRVITTAIHRAIHYLGQILQRCYQIYVPAPLNIWRELHGLYLYAHASNLHNIVVTDELNEAAAATSIMELYKQTVLLALSGPYRLRQTEVDTLSGLLTQWSAYTHINEIVDPESQTGMCSLNLNSDDPPGYLTLCGDKNISYCRVLETSQLINIISEFIAKGIPVHSLGTLGKTNKLRVDVLRRLALTWGGMAKRNFSRTNKNNRMLVTIGLRALYHFIHDTPEVTPGHGTAAAPQKTAEGPKAAPAPLNLVPLDSDVVNPSTGPHFGVRPSVRGAKEKTKHRKKDAWDPLYRLGTPLYDAGAHAQPGAEKSGDDGAEKPRFDIHICTGINESAGGFCFVWIPASDVETPYLNALVGELIGLQELDEENKNRWSIGVVRWMKNRGDAPQLELGVEKLAPYALAAGISKNRNKNSAEFFSGLVLPEIMNVNQPITLIAPNSHDVGDTLLIDFDGERKSVRLTKLLESTGSFSHFRYKELKNPERSRDGALDENAKGNFDNLWSSL